MDTQSAVIENEHTPSFTGPSFTGLFFDGDCHLYEQPDAGSRFLTI